ncbi:MAG: alpha/beta hydrolase [Pirellulaceae bacterium]
MSFHFRWIAATIILMLPQVRPCLAAERIIQLRNGLQLQGSIVELASIDQNAFQAAGEGAVEAKPIWMIDDGLRRTFINQHAMVAPPTLIAPADSGLPIILDQRTPVAGGRVVSAVGSIMGISPFDEFGRRTFTMHGPKGPLTIHQGITEINSRFTKVEGLLSTRSHVWDMRMSTDAFTSKQLYDILTNWIDQSQLEGRLRLFRFFIEAKRYAAARETLLKAIEDFPEAQGLRRQLKTLTQQEASRILDEALLRRDTGQRQFAMQMLSGFPVDDIAIETRIKVQDAIREMNDTKQLAESIVQRLETQVKTLDAVVVADLQPLLSELRRDLNSETLMRMSDYQRLGEDNNIALENRVAMAVGGWLLGAGTGEQNLAIARSLIKVRSLVEKYLASDEPAQREQILNELSNLEGATPENVAKIIRTMKPPRQLPDTAADPEIPGLYRIALPARGEVEEREYLIQLPPEYDPLRSYPCIVTLHQPGRTLEQQIAWWAGDYNPAMGQRMGPASRQGFVVIAPAWQNDGLSGYRFTPREHYRVLSALRDALRRTSIDPNRVFLTGHSAGGSAAWDIALSHPDMWAGLLAISADADMHIRHYADNGKYFPQYFVIGELAGYPAPLVRNGAVLQRYLRPGYDAMLVTYRGRGEEDFYEEIDEMITWMQLRSHRRQAPPQRIEAASMRSGDQFFWWLELNDLKPAVDISPFGWESADRLRAGEITAQITANGDVQITSIPSDSCSVYLMPEMGIKLDQPVRVSWHQINETFVRWQLTYYAGRCPNAGRPSDVLLDTESICPDLLSKLSEPIRQRTFEIQIKRFFMRACPDERLSNMIRGSRHASDVISDLNLPEVVQSQSR